LALLGVPFIGICVNLPTSQPPGKKCPQIVAPCGGTVRGKGVLQEFKLFLWEKNLKIQIDEPNGRMNPEDFLDDGT
jgi:hypothetical protein